MPRYGKSSGKRKTQGKDSCQAHDEDFRYVKVFTLDITSDDKFAERYSALLREIRDYLEFVVKEEVNNLPKGQKKPVTLSGRVYTPSSGYFLIRLDGAAGQVYLLFSMLDLYLKSFYVDGVWYRLSDATDPLPPRSQLYYGRKTTSNNVLLTSTGVIYFIWGSSYLELPGGDVCMFRGAFPKAHVALFNAAEEVLSKTDYYTVAPFFKFFAVVCAEGLRFPDCERWVVFAFLSQLGWVFPPEWLDQLFHQWGKRSSRMYCLEPEPSLDLTKSIRVVKRMTLLHPLLREDILYQKKDRDILAATKARLKADLDASDNMKLLSCDNQNVPEHLKNDNYNYADGNDATADGALALAGAAAAAPFAFPATNPDDNVLAPDKDAIFEKLSLKPESEFSKAKTPNASVPLSTDSQGLVRELGPDALTHPGYDNAYAAASAFLATNPQDDKDAPFEESPLKPESQFSKAKVPNPSVPTMNKPGLVKELRYDVVTHPPDDKSHPPDDKSHPPDDKSHPPDEDVFVAKSYSEPESELSEDKGPNSSILSIDRQGLSTELESKPTTYHLEGPNSSVLSIDRQGLVTELESHPPDEDVVAKSCSEPEYEFSEAAKGPNSSVLSIDSQGLATELKSKPTTYPQRPGASPCKQFLQNGRCHFAEKCRYNHPVDPSAEGLVNRYGLPKRKGADLCKRYAADGSCRLGKKCKFDHPSPVKKAKKAKERRGGLPRQAQ